MKKELAFSIDSSSQVSAPLLIQITEVIRDEKGLLWPSHSQQRKLYRDALLQLASGKERELSAVKTLVEEKNRSLLKSGLRQNSATLDYSEIPVESKRSIPILKELAATGKLYFKQKELIVHFFSVVELFYTVENKENGSCCIQGIIKGSQEYPLLACDLIGQGDPPWLIYQGSLYFLKGEYSWKWMRRAYEERPCILVQKQADRFFEEIEPVSIIGKREKAPSSDPLPVLSLTDPRGVFANLFMDYGEGRLIAFEDSLCIKQDRKPEVELGWKKDLIEAGYQEKRLGESSFYCPVDKVAGTLLFLLELGWKVRDRQGSQVFPQTALHLTMHSQGTFVAIEGSVKFGDREAPISAAVQAAKRGEPLLPLYGGAVGLISKEALLAHSSALFEGEILTDRIRIKRQDVSSLEELFESGAAVASSDETLKKLRETLKSRKVLQKPNPGSGFKGTLRGYQQEGLAWLSFLHANQLHGILADDMGLGKTVQVLAFLSTLEAKIEQPILIVMPRSLLFHWKGEIERFLPSLSLKVHHGAEREGGWGSAQAILTSYATLRQESALFEKKAFSCVILDEAQAIKNSETQTAQAVRRLHAGFRLSMTGTPIENHIGELISQFDFLIPGLFGEEAALDPSLLKNKARPFILRRRKEDVDEELPEKIEQNLFLEMDPPQRAFYDSFLNSLRQGLLKKVSLDGMASHRMEIFEAILRLRQICCHPSLVDSVSDAASIKLEALFLDLETVREEGKKALVYSQFTTMLQLIAKRCREKKWPFAYLDGSTKDREGAVQQFQEDPETPFFLISLKAGGVGLNLTAADYVFLYDPWWNEAVERQAIDRAHRIGRHSAVIAKRYIVKDSIEERMMLLKQSKQAVAENLFEGDTGMKGGLGLDWENLEFLLDLNTGLV